MQPGSDDPLESVHLGDRDSRITRAAARDLQACRELSAQEDGDTARAWIADVEQVHRITRARALLVYRYAKCGRPHRVQVSLLKKQAVEPPHDSVHAIHNKLSLTDEPTDRLADNCGNPADDLNLISGEGTR